MCFHSTALSFDGGKKNKLIKSWEKNRDQTPIYSTYY